MVDRASLQMEFEAEREWLLKIFPPSEAPPPEISPPTQEAYVAGLRQGVCDAMQLDPRDPHSLPLEFEWQFAGAWRIGYATGSEMGALRRDIILTRLAADRTSGS